MADREVSLKLTTSGFDQARVAAKNVETSLKGIGNAAGSLASEVTSKVSGITSSLGRISGISAAIGSTLGGIGLVSIGKQVVEAASNYQRMVGTLTALTGSAEKAKEKMDWLQKFAVPSSFTLEALQTASTRLEAFGLDTQKYLPGLNNLASVFGTDAQNIMEVADALGRLKSGQSGEALEALRRFGIGSDALKMKGIQFDNSGMLKSAPMDAINATMGIIEERFGRMGEVTGNLLASKLSSVGDSWNRVLVKIGIVFTPVLTQLADGVSGLLNKIADSGLVEKISGMFNKLINPDKIMSSLTTAVSWFTAGIEGVPAILSGLWAITQNLQGTLKVFTDTLTSKDTWSMLSTWFVQGIGEGLVVLAGRAGALWTGAVNKVLVYGLGNANGAMAKTTGWALSGVSKMWEGTDFLPAQFMHWATGGLSKVANTIGDIQNFIPKQLLKLIGAEKTANDMYNAGIEGVPTYNMAPDTSKVKAALGDIENVFGNIGARQKEIMATLNSTPEPKGLDKSGSSDKTEQKQGPSIPDLLGSIDTNTFKTAANTQNTHDSLKKYVMGGGDLGEAGVTPVNMYKDGVARGSVSSAAQAFVETVVMRMQRQARFASG